MWCPPTPPTSDDDVYVDFSMDFLYESTPIPECDLPPVYIKKELKRPRVETTTNHTTTSTTSMSASTNDRDNRKVQKRHKDDTVYAPRSLFDRPSAALVKMRRDIKFQKYRGNNNSSSNNNNQRSLITLPVAGTAGCASSGGGGIIGGVKTSSIVKINDYDFVLEWLIHEDIAILQTIQGYQNLSLNLVIISPGHTPNWDLVSDYVNNTSRIHRSGKQCKSRYENVIVPREEGKLLYDALPKKQKKQKGVYKNQSEQQHQQQQQTTKTNRPMRTSQLFNQDKNSNFTTLLCARFDMIKTVSNKRTPAAKSIITNSTGKNSKHATVLADWGIKYDTPLTPTEITLRRVERFAKDKLKNPVN